ncbi:hypothetical protein AGMMS5026_06680 [Endomicrobiia bacterium]|nr:hypothetical protein AGMMS49523_02750 [Endomicrobiia bacterium]GHT07697.1 hypothetical protein AGMMS49532_01000 [Endomicrobiia bacterium]GHT12014.1 hypothetical protein AGMMS49571_03260 [Endomicrobiia bacterium]GHT20924.1 hypothetical protein AGMMS49929_08710 [Endomicrobiia bacterium]GHT26008.1 hypothetical protein AGMMS49995_01560 [Endomicrobiia bacterium]
MKYSIGKTNRLLLEGLKIGFLLQIGSIGPICMLVFRLSLSLPVSKLLMGVVGITLSDLIYTFLAVLSVSAMKKIQQYQRILDIIVGIILIVFGVLFATTGNAVNSDTFGGHDLFIWLFGLNTANPITIVFIAGIFSLEMSKRDMDLKDASIFGFGFLLTTPIFMIIIIIIGKFAGAILPDIVVKILNIMMGIVLIFLGSKNVFWGKKSVEGGKKMRQRQEELRKLFKKNRALLNGHFKLSSGLHSDMYFQAALILQYPKEAVRLAEELAKKIKENNIKVDVVVSPALGGVIIGHEMGRALGVRAIFTERIDSKVSLRRGFFVDKNEKVLVVEDVITTGLSTKEAIDSLKSAGAEALVAVVSLVDRSAGKVDFGVPRFSLLSLEVKSFKEDECPMCKAGSNAVKPGSRK